VGVARGTALRISPPPPPLTHAEPKKVTGPERRLGLGAGARARARTSVHAQDAPPRSPGALALPCQVGGLVGFHSPNRG
jgi:hypothetical protein